jgi:hypothetical protein
MTDPTLTLSGYNSRQINAMHQTIGADLRAKLAPFAPIGGYSPFLDFVGAQGDWKSILIPRRTTFGADLNLPAYWHDRYYDYVATLPQGPDADEARRDADQLFLCLMLDVIEEHDYPYGLGWFARRADRYRAMTYYAAVREHGGSAVLAAAKNKGEPRA